MILLCAFQLFAAILSYQLPFKCLSVSVELNSSSKSLLTYLFKNDNAMNNLLIYSKTNLCTVNTFLIDNRPVQSRDCSKRAKIFSKPVESAEERCYQAYWLRNELNIIMIQWWPATHQFFRAKSTNFAYEELELYAFEKFAKNEALYRRCYSISALLFWL